MIVSKVIINNKWRKEKGIFDDEKNMEGRQV
jgi:hypothetical protein